MSNVPQHIQQHAAALVELLNTQLELFLSDADRAATTGRFARELNEGNTITRSDVAAQLGRYSEVYRDKSSEDRGKDLDKADELRRDNPEAFSPPSQAELNIVSVTTDPAELKADQPFSVTVAVENTTPNINPGEITVTLTLNGSEYTEIAGPDGSAVFTGLSKSAGEYTLTATAVGTNAPSVESRPQTITVADAAITPPTDFIIVNINPGDTHTRPDDDNYYDFVFTFPATAAGVPDQATIVNFTAGDILRFAGDINDDYAITTVSVRGDALSIVFADSTYTQMWNVRLEQGIVTGDLRDQLSAVDASDVAGRISVLDNALGVTWYAVGDESVTPPQPPQPPEPGVDNEVLLTPGARLAATEERDIFEVPFNGNINNATITGFSLQDSFDVSAAPAGSLIVLDRLANNTSVVEMAVGDFNSQNFWMIELRDVEPAFFNAVNNADQWGEYVSLVEVAGWAGLESFLIT